MVVVIDVHVHVHVDTCKYALYVWHTAFFLSFGGGGGDCLVILSVCVCLCRVLQMKVLGDGINEGDVLLSNHPCAGGSHLPDLTVITPVCRVLQLIQNTPGLYI